MRDAPESAVSEARYLLRKLGKRFFGRRQTCPSVAVRDPAMPR